MSAAERIWAKSYYHSKGRSGYWEDEPIHPNYHGHQGTEYVRKDLCCLIQDEYVRAEAAEAKLREAVELLNEPVATHKDPEWRHARSAFLASLEADQ